MISVKRIDRDEEAGAVTMWTWDIDIAKLNRLKALLITPCSISGALSLMDDCGDFAGLDTSAMIEVFRIAERLRKDPDYLTHRLTAAPIA